MPSQLEAILDRDTPVGNQLPVPLPPAEMSLAGRVMKGLPRRERAVSGPAVLSQTDPAMTVRPCDVEMKDELSEGICQDSMIEMYD